LLSNPSMLVATTTARVPPIPMRSIAPSTLTTLSSPAEISELLACLRREETSEGSFSSLSERFFRGRYSSSQSAMAARAAAGS